jgi:hypothetical protein
MLILTTEGKELVYNSNGKFRILQLTDLHWKASSKESEKTKQVIESIVKQTTPDLLVLTGDIVTYEPALAGWTEVCSILEKLNVKWAVTMGNHDHEQEWTNSQILDFVTRFKNCVSIKGSNKVNGDGNYILPLMSSKGKSISNLLYFFDSNAYSKMIGGYDWIKTSQINWYEQLSTYYTNLNSGFAIPSLAFFHIPLPEYKDLASSKKFIGSFKEAVACPKLNSGMFLKMVEMQDIMGCFVGHDHVNDYIGSYYNIALGYGRKTGHHSYGDLVKGGRVIELIEGERAFDSWVVTPDKSELFYKYPEAIYYNKDKYFPSKRYSNLTNGVNAQYYEGKYKKLDDVKSTDLKEKILINKFSLKNAKREDFFAFKYEAVIKIEEKGIYQFYTKSDDGSKLYIDNQLVVDNDGSHSARFGYGYIALDKGYHDIRVEYFEDHSGQELQVGFSKYKMKKRELKAEELFVK